MVRISLLPRPGNLYYLSASGRRQIRQKNSCNCSRDVLCYPATTTLYYLPSRFVRYGKRNRKGGEKGSLASREGGSFAGNECLLLIAWWIAFTYRDPLIPESVAIHFLLALFLARLPLVCGLFSHSFFRATSLAPRGARHGAFESYDLGTEINEAAIIKKRKFMPAARTATFYYAGRSGASGTNKIGRSPAAMFFRSFSSGSLGTGRNTPDHR